MFFSFFVALVGTLKLTYSLCVNVVKALVSEIWIGSNHWIFQQSSQSYNLILPSLIRFDSGQLKSSLWCFLFKKFKGHSNQDIYCN